MLKRSNIVFLLSCLALAFFLVLSNRFPYSIESPQLELTQLARFPMLLSESSALASSQDFLWTLNDSGAGATIHKLDAQGNYLESLNIPAIDNIDWESMAGDEEYLYISDTGNNGNTRGEFTIYKIAWESLSGGEIAVEEIRLRYADYVSGAGFSHNFDAEGLAVKGNELWLFSKNRGDGNTNLYRFPAAAGRHEAAISQTLPVDALITAADINPVTGELALIGSHSSGLDTLWRAPTTDSGVLWNDMSAVSFGPNDQWEAVLWDPGNNRLLFTHERNRRGYAGLAELKIE